MDTIISKAELYPDLELPTIDELTTLGWHFVRYKFQDTRVYVDPDFYFVYMTQLTSQYLRELILQSVDNGVDGTFTAADPTGSKSTIKPAKNIGFSATSNEAMTAQLKAINDKEKSVLALGSKRKKSSVGQEQSAANKVDDFSGWEVCNDIKAFFLEKQYLKELEAYEFAASKNGNEYTEYSSEQDDSSSDYVEDQNTAYKDTTLKAEKNGTIKDYTSDDSSEVSTTTYTEGAWVHGQLLNTAGKAYSLIMDYIRNTPIDLESPETGTIREEFIQAKVKGQNTGSYYETMETEIKNQVQDFLSRSAVKEILELIGVDVSSDFLSVSSDIIYSAACAATGEKEYSSKKKSVEWKPAVDFIGIGANGNSQDKTDALPIYSVEQAIYNAKEFGCFKINQYTIQEYQSIYQGRKCSLNGVISNEDIEAIEIFEDATNEERAAVSSWGDKAGTVASTHRVLDPYYSSTERTMDEVVSYIRGCINSPKYCTEAFMRNVLYYLALLMDYKVIPSINGDLLRSSTKANTYEAQKEKYYGAANSDLEEKNSSINDHLKFFTKNVYTLDAGKIWAATVLAVTHRNKTLFNKMLNRDIKGLNELSNCVSIPESKINTEDQSSVRIRKMQLALIGLKRNTQASAQGIPQNNPTVQSAREMTEKKYLEAADDPTQYPLHSCHDMIVHDGRGRMVRAFPTYYMLFIDEGRDIGTYHLYDNFYNNSCISEFTVVKDRKNPADTANIVMGNFYQSFSTENDDQLKYDELSWGDAISSIFDPVFRPEKYGKFYANRRNNQNIPAQIRIRPGARIHLRAGYGSNATMLPILFNGTIAEVSAENVVNIVAQGDGLELLNPIQIDTTANSLANDSGYQYNKNTPANLMRDILTTDGTILQSFLKHAIGRPDLLGANPFGIYHFGSKDYKDINATGEVCQNIFEALPNPAWGETEQNRIFNYNTQNESNAGLRVPEINFDVFQKTPWQCANICKSVMPDFICGVAPFDYRSTLFIGAPRYYYAYGYTNINGAIQEKRKPYQQYHLYTSSTDIIADGITASSKNIHTNAVGLYVKDAAFNTKEQHTTDVLYVDADIYPENQKSMIVDTQLHAKGAPYIGAITNLIESTYLWDEVSTFLTQTAADIASVIPFGDSHTTDKTKGTPESLSWDDLAWNMTASALKDSMKEMYCGDLVVLGDATVKPHDRIFIMDDYQSISGQATVKEVVHRMSVNEGFVTTISPDLISSVKDSYELTVHSWSDKVFGLGATAMISTVATYISSKYNSNAIYKGIINALGEYQNLQVVKDLTTKLQNKLNAKEKFEKDLSSLNEERKKLYSELEDLKKNNAEKSVIKAKEEEINKVEKSVTQKEKYIKEIEEAVETFKKYSKKVKNRLPSKVTSALDKINNKISAKNTESALKTIEESSSKMAKNSALAKFLSSKPLKLAGNLLSKIANVIMITQFLGTLLAKKLRNYQVMTVFPLYHFDLAWTAGLAGSKGLVYGSPSYSEQGALQTLIASVVPEEGSIGVGVMSFFMGEQFVATCKSYERNNEVITNSSSSSEITFNKNNEFVIPIVDGKANLPKDYRRLQMTDRCSYEEIYSDETDDDTKNEKMEQLKQSINYFGITDTDVTKFADNRKFIQNKFISDDIRIKEYIQQGFFKVIHEDPNAINSLDPRLETTVLKIKGIDKHVKYLVDDYVYDQTTGENITTYDFPMLNQDAIDVLFEIIKRARNYMPGANASDPYEFYDETKNSYIVLTSALKVGDTSSLASCGFSFTLKGTDKAQEALTKAVEDFHDEIANNNVTFSSASGSIFYTDSSSDDTQINFLVSMPVVIRDTVPYVKKISIESTDQ